jgi:hypothetical protein
VRFHHRAFADKDVALDHGAGGDEALDLGLPPKFQVTGNSRQRFPRMLASFEKGRMVRLAKIEQVLDDEGHGEGRK